MDFTVQSSDLEALIGAASGIARNDTPIRLIAERIGERLEDTGADNTAGAPEAGRLRVIAFNDTLVSEWRTAATIRMTGSAAIMPGGLDRLVRASKASDASIDIATSGTDNAPALRLTTSRSAHEFPLSTETIFETVDPGAVTGEPADLSNLARAISVARIAAAPRAEAAGAKIALTGVHLRGADGMVDVVATDGRRLALSRLSGEALGTADLGLDTAPITLPPESLPLLIKMLEDGQTRLMRQDTALVVETPGGIVSLRLLDSPYPDYSPLLGLAAEHTITLSRDDLEIALARSSATVSKDNRATAVKLSRGADGLHLSSTASSQTSSECLDETAGTPCEVGFDARYMTNAIAALPGGEIDLSFGTHDIPIRVTSDARPDVTMLVMPCRV